MPMRWAEVEVLIMGTSGNTTETFCGSRVERRGHGIFTSLVAGMVAQCYCLKTRIKEHVGHLESRSVAVGQQGALQ